MQETKKTQDLENSSSFSCLAQSLQKKKKTHLNHHLNLEKKETKPKTHDIHFWFCMFKSTVTKTTIYSLLVAY